MFTDATSSRLGVVSASLCISCPIESTTIFAAEAKAAALGLARSSGDVALHLDNQGLFHALRKGSSRHPDANALCKEVFYAQHDHRQRRFRWRWLPSEANVADFPTRPHRLNDVCLAVGEVQRLERVFNMTLRCDLFAASSLNAQCPTFLTDFWAFVEANGGLPAGPALAFPPPPMIPDLLALLLETDVEVRGPVVFVYPAWEAEWSPLRRRLALSDSVRVSTVGAPRHITFAACLI